jgi:hypothetical protein
MTPRPARDIANLRGLLPAPSSGSLGHLGRLIQKSLVPQHTCQHSARLDLPVVLEANDIVETKGGLLCIRSRVAGDHLLQMVLRPDNVDYVAGVSNAETTAERTFDDRAGVCRDFTHLGITFARALGIPARAVSAYALQLDPPDFHAIFEVYIENDWWLIDPTRLAPIEGIVRIGSGRDASDIAFLTSDQQCQAIRQTVELSRA